MKPYNFTFVLALLFTTATLRGQNIEPELGPMPREALPSFKVEKITAGYQVTLSRENAELLLSMLKKIKNEDAIGELLRMATKDVTEPENVAKIEYLFLAITKETPAFRKALEEKLKDNEKGVVITVYGVVQGKERPVLKSIGKAFLPKDINEKAEGIMTIVRTRAALWRIDSK
jgi:hypothetical protein